MDNGTVGTVLKANEEDQVLLMVAYDPNTMPHRGMDGFIDVVSARAIEKACWKFSDNGAKVSLFHKGMEHQCRTVENYIYRNPEPWVIKNKDGSEIVVKEGCWIVAIKCDDPTWLLYKAGLIGGASPEGRCQRIPPRKETLARIAASL